MLILTRRPDETIVVETPSGKKIEMTVLGVQGNQVRIGVNADPDVAIDRLEIFEKKQAEDEQKHRPAA